MPNSSHIRDAIAALEKRKAELDTLIREAVAERDDIDAALESLASRPEPHRSRETMHRDEDKEIRVLITASPRGLDAEEVSARGGLPLAMVEHRLSGMVQRGEITVENGRYLTKSVVPGAANTRTTVASARHTPDVASS